MSTLTEFGTIKKTDAVVSVVTLHLQPERSPEILAEIVEALRREYGSLRGFISADVLLSLDEKTLAIVSEWTNVNAWGESRYDPRVGELLENCLKNSTALAFEIYYRKSHFAGET